jgi:hypothetical protein
MFAFFRKWRFRRRLAAEKRVHGPRIERYFNLALEQMGEGHWRAAYDTAALLGTDGGCPAWREWLEDRIAAAEYGRLELDPPLHR